MTVRYYLGKLGQEQLIHTMHNASFIPSKSDFVALDDDDPTNYKVMYRTYLPFEDTYEIFMREAISEDF